MVNLLPTSYVSDGNVELKRLLELFPVSSLRQEWPELKGKKEDICTEIAQNGISSRIVDFVDEHLSCCKQHIYVLDQNTDLSKLPSVSIPDAHLVKRAKDDESVRMQQFPV